MNKKELQDILNKHKNLIDGKPGGERADLQWADLRDADLKGADLKGADLEGADLQGADLRDTDMWFANLQGANLQGADLEGADLEGADLQGIETDAETKIDWPMVCPEVGSFVGWKKAGGYIVKLYIPEDAERSSATTNRCRASKAKVLEIQDMHGARKDVQEVTSYHGGIYKVGKMVYPDSWDDNRWNECTHGIHFFMTRAEATRW